MKSYFHKTNPSEDSFCTDLATERRRVNPASDGVEYRISECDGGTWECVRITSDAGARAIGRPIGIYDTLNMGRMDLLDEDEIADATDSVARKLCEIFDCSNILPGRILVVGLGNRSLTPDSVGPRCAELIRATMHIRDFDDETFDALDCSEIIVLTPGVSMQSGMDASEIVRGVSNISLPDAVIAIDAIASRSTERLGTTIQISNTGIFPGSGVGNTRLPLNRDSLGVPVIAIGVPTVIDSSFISHERNSDESMLVCPKEIDEITAVSARIIAGAVNQAFGISPY